MQRFLISKVLVVVVMITLCLNGVHAFAEEGAAKNGGEIITPNYVRIIICANNLTLNSGGRLTCEGETEVQYGYTAGVTMELQSLNGSTWSTIKTWSGTNWQSVYLARDWYVARGTYRLRLTHRSLTSGGSLIEDVVKYSRIVIY